MTDRRPRLADIGLPRLRRCPSARPELPAAALRASASSALRERGWPTRGYDRLVV